ncbi:hypothetical protein [Actinoplanes sandaracinus]|uniref:hypothetical protein n=1 Tax=Actinoplanes sandaracinus TaxID=3045177 RepID=UPI002E1A95FE
MDRSRKLAPQQWLRTSAGTQAQVSAVRHHAAQAVVHNLTVADIHTYYVVAGTAPVLVHNIGCGDFLKKKEGDDPDTVRHNNLVEERWRHTFDSHGHEWFGYPDRESIPKDRIPLLRKECEDLVEDAEPRLRAALRAAGTGEQVRWRRGTFYSGWFLAEAEAREVFTARWADASTLVGEVLQNRPDAGAA